MHRRTIIAGAAALVAARPALAQGTWNPDRPVRVIVPFGAGGGTDLTARVVAARYVNDAGKWKWYTDKADPIYRKLRRAAKVLPSAFVAVQLPPSGRRTKKSDEDSSED